MSIYFRKTLSKHSFLTSSWGDPFYSSFNKRWIFAMTAGTSPTEWIAHITVSSPAMHPTTPVLKNTDIFMCKICFFLL